MVGAERAACDDARLQILDVAVFKMLGCFTADNHVARDDGSRVDDGLRHVIQPLIHALAMMPFALLKHAEEAGNAFVILGQGLRRAVGVHATALAAVAFAAARHQRHVFDGAVALVRALIQLAPRDHRAARASLQIDAHRIGERGVEPEFGHG